MNRERLEELARRAWRWLVAHRPSRRQGLRALPVLVPVLVLGWYMVRNLDVPSLPDYRVPEGFTPAPPPATDPPAAPVELAAVDGTTSTLPPGENVGSARLRGMVTVPEGAMPGATVRIERFVGETVQAVDVLTGPDGSYDVGGIAGGRYRVRAFLPPTLGMAEAQVFFLGRDEERTVDLALQSFGQVELSIAVAPSPPIVDQAVNVLVAVSMRQVDAEGFVRAQPLVGVTVELTVQGPWQAPATTTTTTSTSTSSPGATTTTTTTTPSAGSRVTASDGTVRATFVCRNGSGATVVTATVAQTGGAPPVTERVDVPACINLGGPSPTVPTSTASSTTTTTDPDD